MSWFLEMCEEMESRHGERGWKRRLAEMLGVSDSNVQNWIRVGDAPPIVRTAFEAKQALLDAENELAARERDKFVIQKIEGGQGFRVLGLDSESGHFIEWATTKDLNLARAVAHVASGALDQKISAVWACLAGLIEDHPDEQRTLNDLMDWRKPTRREQDTEITKFLEVLNDPKQ